MCCFDEAYKPHAKTGLTASAAEYACDKGLLVSTERELLALAERLGVRFGK